MRSATHYEVELCWGEPHASWTDAGGVSSSLGVDLVAGAQHVTVEELVPFATSRAGSYASSRGSSERCGASGLIANCGDPRSSWDTYSAGLRPLGARDLAGPNP